MSERISVTEETVLTALGKRDKPSGETDIMLALMGILGIKQVEKPGEKPGDSIRRHFNVASLRNALAALAGDGKVLLLTGAEWSERGVGFYGQRPTGKYWARTDAEFLAPKPEKKEKPGGWTRTAFDTALNTMLVHENLAGTEWAIRQIRETATEAGRLDDEVVADVLNGLAGQLEAMRDKRVAELVSRDMA